VARGGTHWNCARVAEIYSIGMVYDALAPTVYRRARTPTAFS
jgi:hypothetical protein